MTVRNKISQIIDKGGSVSADKEANEWTVISVRIPKKMLNELRNIIKERPGMNQTSMILEAIKEKIEKNKP